MTASPTFEELVATDFPITSSEHAWPTFEELLTIDIALGADDVAALSGAEFGAHGSTSSEVGDGSGGRLASSLLRLARRLTDRLH